MDEPPTPPPFLLFRQRRTRGARPSRLPPAGVVSALGALVASACREPDAGGPFTPFEIGVDHVLGARFDEMDVEHVQVLGIRKP